MITTAQINFFDSATGYISAYGVMKLGEEINPGEITGNTIFDVIIKVGVPLIAAVITPVVSKVLIPYLKKKLKL